MKQATNDIIPQGYKMTDLGALPEEWEVVKLGDVVDVKGGKRLPKGHSFSSTPTPYPYIRVIDFSNWSVKTTELKYLTLDDREIIKKYIITHDDVYISIAGTIGLVGSIPPKLNKANLTENAARLIIRDPRILDKLFLIGYLAAKQGQYEISIRASKTSQPKLALNRIKQIPAPLPTLPEQQKIASVLSAVQEAKEKTEAVIAATKALKKSMMKHLFTYGPVSLQEAETVPLKETKMVPVPEDWEVVQLGEVAKTIKGRKPQQLSEDLKEGSIPYLTAEYFRTKKVSKFVPKDVKNSIKVNEDDIVFIWDGSNAGDVFTGLSGVLASTMIKIEPEGNINKKFLYYYLKTKFLLFNTKTTGSTIPHVNKTLFYNLPAPLPPLPTQQKIASILSAIDAKIEAEENKKQALEELFKTLLDNLITAKIRVNHLEVPS